MVSAFFAFIYALFGMACVYLICDRAKKRGGKPAIVTWIFAFGWYAALGMGLSFTAINWAHRHSQAGWVGLIGTIIVAAALGFVVYRLANSKLSGRSA
jgi:drug/metabolite transporter (DMT)-like permease